MCDCDLDCLECSESECDAAEQKAFNDRMMQAVALEEADNGEI